MKKQWKRLWSWRPAEKWVAVGAAGVLLVILIPLLRLCEYAVPWFDDYGYATYVKEGYAQGCTLADAIKGGISAAVDEWHHWEGTYMAIFLGAQVPLIWGEEWYGLGPAFLILLLTFSVLVLVRVVLRNILEVSGWCNVIVQAGCAAMLVMFIYSAQRGFYWYDGGVFYVAMSSFTMLYVAAMIKLWKAEGRKGLAWLLGSMLLAILVAGGNYVTTLQGMLLTVTFLMLAVWKNRRLLVRFLPLTAVYTFGFCMNVLAPGNSARGESFTGWGMSPVKAVLSSFVEAVRRTPEFTGLRTVLVLLLLSPFLWRLVRKTKFSFSHPLFMLAGSFCIYAAAYTPALYALGSVVLARMLCTIKITFQIALLWNELYLLGWLCRKYEKGEECHTTGMPYWWFYPLMTAAMLLVFSQEPNQAGYYSAYGAYYYIHTGEAYNFYQEYQARLEILKNEEPVVVVQPYTWRPWFLCAGELSEDPYADRNRMVARWYQKQSVSCAETTTQ